MDYISDQEFVEFLQYLRYRMDTDPGSVNDILDKVISDANICKRYVDRRGEEITKKTHHHYKPEDFQGVRLKEAFDAMPGMYEMWRKGKIETIDVRVAYKKLLKSQGLF